MPAHAAQRAQDIHPEGAGQPSALANRGALTHPHASERRVVQPLTGVTQHPQSLQPRERSLSSQREHLPPFRQLLHSDFQTSPAGHAHPPYSPRASAGSSAEGPSPRPSPHVGPSPTRTGSGLDVLLGERPLARSAAIAFPPAWELANPGPSTSGPVSTPMQPDGRRWSTSRPDYRGWDAAAGLVTVDSTRQPSGPGGAIRPHGTGMLHRSASVGHAPMGSAPAPTLGEAFATMSPTGTQTLRRLTGEQIVPGEGPCYVYEDGTYCRTVVEGEPVNPHWGLTKAGRPRKRLAEACLTCRLKKIKCEPDRPKCVQCEKLGRVCRFKTAPREAYPAGELQVQPYYRPSDAMSLAGAMTSPEQDSGSHTGSFTAGAGQAPGSVGQRKWEPPKDQTRRMSSESDLSQPDSAAAAGNPPKRCRRRSPQRLPPPSPRLALLSPTAELGHGSGNLSGSGILDVSSMFQWPADPFETHPGLVLHLMNLYFDHVNSAFYQIFPRTPFFDWLQTYKHKSEDDLMLIYVMLTAASNFSKRSDRKTFSKELTRISSYALDHRRNHYTIQLVQSRLIYALHLSASNKTVESWDLEGAAIRAAIGLRLNLERSADDVRQNTLTEFALGRDGYLECRRRTFWAVYLADVGICPCSSALGLAHVPPQRHGRLGSVHGCTLQDDDIFLRLPCDDKTFEAQLPSQAPFFDASVGEPSTNSIGHGVGLGKMAHLVQISSVMGQVLKNIFRCAQIPDSVYQVRHARFLERVQAQLDRWRVILPSNVVYNESNIDASIQDGSVGMFASIHSLHHTTQLLLHRYTRPGCATREALVDHMQRCQYHARAILQMVRDLVRKSNRMPFENHSFGTPFLASALTLAWDVLGAKGAIRSLPEVLPSLRGGLQLLDDMKPYWRNLRPWRDEMSSRLAQLERLVDGVPNLGHPGQSEPVIVDEGVYHFATPLTATLSSQDNLVYALRPQDFLSLVSEAQSLTCV